MVNIEPLNAFLKSRDALKAGDRQKALLLLAESLGATAPTPYMESVLDSLTKESNPAVLTLILHESKGGSDGRF